MEMRWVVGTNLTVFELAVIQIYVFIDLANLFRLFYPQIICNLVYYE